MRLPVLSSYPPPIGSRGLTASRTPSRSATSTAGASTADPARRGAGAPRGGARGPAGADRSRPSPNRLPPSRKDASDTARGLMHGIFVGEIQALEGAGRTAYDYTTAETPFAMKLDMARQCWDEARHVEISLLLGEHMGTEIGEYSEAVITQPL